MEPYLVHLRPATQSRSRFARRKGWQRSGGLQKTSFEIG